MTRIYFLFFIFLIITVDLLAQFNLSINLIPIGGQTIKKSEIQGALPYKNCDLGCSPTAIKENEKETGFVLYPNPTDGLFTVKTEQFTNKQNNLIIYNSMGQIVFKEQIQSVSNTIYNCDALNHNNNQPGIYVVQIQQEDIVVSQRLIKINSR